MKVLMIIGQYHPLSGGAEKECQKVAGRLLREGMEVAVLTQAVEGLPVREVIGAVPVYRKMKGGHLYEYTYMLSVLWFLLKHVRRYDIIQCFGLYLYIPPVVLVRYLFKKRAVARVEGPGASGDFQRIRKLRCGQLILKSARRLDRLIAISGDISREAEASGFEQARVVTIPNSVDVDHFRPGEGRGGTICFVGRLAEEKGVGYLIEAMREIRRGGEGSSLSIVGDGPLRSDLENLSRRLGVMDQTVFVGNTDAVLPYYQGAALFVLPSLAEGLPLSLLEAMSCGLPVVVTAVGGSREVVDPDDQAGRIPPSQYQVAPHGILVNPRDVQGLARAVARVLKDRELSRHLGRAAQEYVQRTFSLESVIKRYRALYAALG